MHGIVRKIMTNFRRHHSPFLILLLRSRIPINFYVHESNKENIARVGPEKVYAVVFDGGTDFTATEPMIQEIWPWISFLYWQSHGV